MLVLLRRVINERLRRPAEQTRTPFDDLAVELLSSTHSHFIIVFSLYAGSLVLVLPEALDLAIWRFFIFVFALEAASWGNTVIVRVLDIYRRRDDLDGSSQTAAAAMGFLSRLGLFALLTVLVLDNYGVDVTALVAGIGISSLALALALQNILKDLFASLSIVMDKPFEIGDFIVIGDLKGRVEHVGLRTTRVRSLSGEQLVFPNNDLLVSRIRNYKRLDERRVVLTFGVKRSTAQEKLLTLPDLVREVIEATDDTRFDRSHFTKFGADELEVETVYFVTSAGYNRFKSIQQLINLDLFQRLGESGIELTMSIESSEGSS